jgi:hypothetical protein
LSAQETTAFTFGPKIEPERALHLGAAAAIAPLWAAYFAATSTGVAYWWMTAWTRRGEQKSFAPKALVQPALTVVEAAEAPVVEAVAEIVEAAPKVELAAVEAPVAKPVVKAAVPTKPAAPKTVSAKTATKPKSVRPKS